METRLFGPEVWEQLLPEVQGYILALEEAWHQSMIKIALLEQHINKLEAELSRSSSNP